MRYIPVGGDKQLGSIAVSIKFVTAESEVVPNAARNIPLPLATSIRQNFSLYVTTIKYNN